MLTQPSPDRAAAYDILMRVASGGYSNIALRAGLRAGALDVRQRAFCSALVYGVLERRLALDWALSRCVSRPLDRLDAEVLCILRMGAFQLLYLNAVPAAAAVDQSVALCRRARKSSASGFVNGVLRALARTGTPPPPEDPAGRMSVELCAPAALVDFLSRAYGADRAREILLSALEPAPLYIRCNTLRADADALSARLREEGAGASPAPLDGALTLEHPGDVAALGSFRDGWFHVQDLASQRCAIALDAREGMRVLDVCAAPGGKSFTAAERMKDAGTLVACDLHPHKAELIRGGAARLGLSCVLPKVQDATEYNPELKEFDRVLCDVPCSGLGAMRRRPEIRDKDLSQFDALPGTQYKILENSAHYLREGGLLVYSTCTLSPAENEEVVARFLAHHSAFVKAPSDALGGEWRRTFFPGEDGDGFFVAVLAKGGGDR